MPRSSLNHDRLERGSAGKGSLGRYSIATDISVGSNATRHWVNSVSDIYGPDEIEELLEDLNRLELAAFETEEFDIDGSQVGGARRGRSVRGQRGPGGGGGRNNGVSSPTFSVRSWDSHAGHALYHHPSNDEYGDPGGGCVTAAGRLAGPADGREGDDGDAGAGGAQVDEEEEVDLGGRFPSAKSLQSILCYCDASALVAPRTLLRILLLITSVACLSAVATSGTAKVGFFALPQFPRLRIMMFVCIFTILFTVFVLFLNISHLGSILPFDAGKMQTLIYLLVTVAYIVSSSLLFDVYPEYGHLVTMTTNSAAAAVAWTKNHVLIASILGFLCGAETFLCMFNCGPTKPYDKMVPESSTHFTLQEVVPPPPSHAAAAGGRHASAPPAEDEEEYMQQVHQPTGRKSSKQYLVNENFGVDKPQQSRQSVKHNQSHNNPPPSAANPASSKPSAQQQQQQPPAQQQQQPQPSSSSHPPPQSQRRPEDTHATTAATTAKSASGEKSRHPHSSKQHQHQSDPPVKDHHQPGGHHRHRHKSSSKTAEDKRSSPECPATTTTTRADVEVDAAAAPSEPPPPAAAAAAAPSKATGAIPKQKKPPPSSSTLPVAAKTNTNHLDEIVTLPLEDDDKGGGRDDEGGGAAAEAAADGGGGGERRSRSSRN